MTAVGLVAREQGTQVDALDCDERKRSVQARRECVQATRTILLRCERVDREGLLSRTESKKREEGGLNFECSGVLKNCHCDIGTRAAHGTP